MSGNKTLTDTYKYVKRTAPNPVLKGRKDLGVNIKASTSQRNPDSPVLNDKELLRQFDLTLEFGPCIGITRLERWERAHRHGLNPALEVKNIILQNKDNPKFTECVWNDYTI